MILQILSISTDPTNISLVCEDSLLLSTQCTLQIVMLLPPAYVVRGKVIFIFGNVCLFTICGGVPHLADRGVPHPRWGGYLILGPGGGGVYLIPGLGRGRGVPQGTPRLRLDGVTPIQDWMGYPPPHPRLDGVFPPCPRLDGVPPPPIQDWME